MSVNAARDELAALLELAVEPHGLGISIYSFVPGAASLPALIVGLPRRYVPVYTSGLKLLELPVYVVTTSADPDDLETMLLDLVELVCPLLKGLRGSSFASARVVDVDQYYDVEVGTTSALSATVNAELTLR